MACIKVVKEGREGGREKIFGGGRTEEGWKARQNVNEFEKRSRNEQRRTDGKSDEEIMEAPRQTPTQMKGDNLTERDL